jgi:transcriptional regulator with XRE-family HTH domain
MESASFYKKHHGRNVRRLREILGVKQESIALVLSISQQAMSKLEQKDEIDDETLERISNILGVPANSIKNFNDEAAVNIIASTFSELSFNDSSSLVGYKQVFNPIEKMAELYERMLKVEQEKNTLLEKVIREIMSDSSSAME